jgi:hypothetical protein
MDENSDYLTLWTHYESRGFDDKNRMIATASLLISFAGALLGASFGSIGASPADCGSAGHSERPDGVMVGGHDRGVQDTCRAQLR